jgi:hypothetical protein
MELNVEHRVEARPDDPATLEMPAKHVYTTEPTLVLRWWRDLVLLMTASSHGPASPRPVSLHRRDRDSYLRAVPASSRSSWDGVLQERSRCSTRSTRRLSERRDAAGSSRSVR